MIRAPDDDGASMMSMTPDKTRQQTSTTMKMMKTTKTMKTMKMMKTTTSMMMVPVLLDVVPWPKSQWKREAALPKFYLEV